MEGVDNQALTEKAVKSPRVMMITVNLDNITSPERVETWFFGFSDLSAFKIYGTSYLQKWMVVELFAHTVGVVKNGP